MSLFCYIGPWLIRFLLGACVLTFFYAVVYHSMCCRCFEKFGVQARLSSIFGGLTACLSAFCFGDSAQAILAFAFCGVLLCTALIDIETLEIPDRIHVIILVLAVLSTVHSTEVAITNRLLGAVIVSVPMLLIALLVSGGFGGGDIKLMAASGLLLGTKEIVVAAFVSMLTGSIYSAYLLITKQAQRDTQIAFGPFLCTGLAFAVFWGHTFADWYLSLLTF